MDEQGRPIRGARAEVRRPDGAGYEFATSTAEDGLAISNGQNNARRCAVVQVSVICPRSPT